MSEYQTVPVKEIRASKREEFDKQVEKLNKMNKLIKIGKKKKEIKRIKSHYE